MSIDAGSERMPRLHSPWPKLPRRVLTKTPPNPLDAGVSPWLEVTRQEYLEARIWNDETKDQKELERIRQSRTRTRYEIWMEEAPKRKREREEALAAAEKADPEQAATARKEAERIEREITAQLKAAEAQDRADNAEVLAQGMPGDHARARLAALTPEERRELEEHINACPNCFVLADTTRQTVRVYKKSGQYELPEGVRQRLMKAIEKKIASRKC